MTIRITYDLTKDPPAPILPVRVGATDGKWAAVTPSIVDTGADVSVIPAQLAKELNLPPAGEMIIQGATGARTKVFTYRAELEVAGIRLAVPVAGLGREMIIGRDVLNRWTLILRGPEEALELEPASGSG